METKNTKITKNTKNKLIWGIPVLIMLVLPNLSYLWGLHYSQPELPYSGRPYESAYDTSTYLSFLKQNQEGHLLYRYQYSVEEHPRIIFRPFWAFFGLGGRIFNAAPIVTYHAMRLLSALFLLGCLIYFLRKYFDSFGWQLVGFITICASGGWGWLLFFLPEKQYLHLFSDAARVNFSFWSAIGGFPQLAYSLALILLILTILPQAFLKADIRLSGMAGIFGLLLGLEHPFDLLPLILVFAVWAGELCRQKQIAPAAALKIMGIFALLSSPAALYNIWLFSHNPVFRSVIEQNITPSFGPFAYILGFGIVLILALIGGHDISQKKYIALYPFVVWALLLPCLLYLPISFNCRLAEGSHIILGFLAAWGLKALWETRLQTVGRKTVFITLIILLTLPINFYYLHQEIRAYQKRAYPCFVPRQFSAATDWLQKNTRPQEGVLVNYALGNLIPAAAGNRVFMGHWSETAYLTKKEKLWGNFLQINWPESERQKIFAQYNMQFLCFTYLDQTGGYDPDNSVYLQKVYENPSVKIYRVKEQ